MFTKIWFSLIVGIFLSLCGLNIKYSYSLQYSLSSLKSVERGFSHHCRRHSHVTFHRFKQSVRQYHRDIEGSAEKSNRIFEIQDSMGIQANDRKKDVIIIGGGQAGLAVSYFLRRTNLSYLLLDNEEGSGGAWRHGWDSLSLFSPAQWSSLPGWSMPSPADNSSPSRNHVISYLRDYEIKYHIPVERPVNVKSVKRAKDSFIIFTDKGEWASKAVISATGTWSNPYIPNYPGSDIFHGIQIHSAFYQNSERFTNHRVLIVGGGNSGAQILAEVSKVADTTWVTPEPPLFLPDDVDGRVLFERATERWKALQKGITLDSPKGSLANIVMVPSVKEARERNVLNAIRPFSRFIEDGVVWEDGTQSHFDSVIWCTGFKPSLEHLRELGVLEEDGKVKVNGTQSMKEPHLWLVGYGDWVGFASATLIGVTRTARDTATQVNESLGISRRE